MVLLDLHNQSYVEGDGRVDTTVLQLARELCSIVDLDAFLSRSDHRLHNLLTHSKKTQPTSALGS